MKVLTGHLTPVNKKAIKAILTIGITTGKVNRTSYFITSENGVYTVKMIVKDRGLIPVPGSELRLSTYKATFKL